MTDDELAMAYADGELDPISAKRFEKRMSEAPELAEAVRRHRALRETLAQGFAPVSEGTLPGRFTTLLRSDVVELPARRRFGPRWRVAASMAACLVAGVAIGHLRQAPVDGVSGGRIVASSSLARALDRQLAGEPSGIRVLVSYRSSVGQYCRVFAGPAIDGIACREDEAWTIQRLQAHTGAETGEYRQAGASAADLMAAAQEAMVGEPLDPAAEIAARRRGWR